MAVDTRKSNRRPLRLASLDDLEAEIDRLEAAHAAGTLRATGNWTPGQVLGHLAKWMSFYFDGFPFSAPWFVRLAGPLAKRWILARGYPTGMRFSPRRGSVGDDPEYSFEEGLPRLRAQIARLRSGERMEAKNPVMRLTHEEGVRLHLRHAELHLSFLYPDGTA